MKLNPDCIRDILLAVEETTNSENPFQFTTGSDFSKLSAYTDDELFYHIRQCEWSGLITGVKYYLDHSLQIADLSPKGHEFLANIRKDTVWKDVKEVAAKVGSISLSALTQISTAVVREIIRAQIGF